MSEEIGGPAPGTTLAGKYLVEKTLGVGGMGVVVSAMHLQLDQRVALKYLLPDALKNPEVVERFAREAKAAARIRGPHVARVIDVGRFDDGAPYMVMEYLDGHDLGKQLELHGALPIADAVRYLLETCEALAEAHAAKIVHRDLKPSNLFLATQPDRRSIVKVLDFGISKMGDAGSAALTRTQAMMGTAYYMSPEQMMSPKDIDHRSDIWALGIILYELLAGHQPFRGESVAEIIAQILQNEPVPLTTVRPDIPEGIAQVIAKCMQSKAANRWDDVADLAQALAPFGGDGDRKSVDTIARVLGKSSRPPATPVSALAAATAMPGQRAPLQTGPQQKATIVIPTPAAGMPVPVAAPGESAAVSVQTAHGLSHSSVGLSSSKKTSPFMIVGAAALLVGLVGGGLVITRKNAPPPEAPSVGVMQAVAPPAATSIAQPAIDTAKPSDPAKPGDGAKPSEPPKTAGGGAMATKPAVVATPPVIGKPSATPNVAVPPVSATPPPPPPPPPDTKNPLEIKIK